MSTTAADRYVLKESEKMGTYQENCFLLKNEDIGMF